MHFQNFFYISKIFLNFQKILWPFKKPTYTTPPKLFSNVDFRKSKYMTFRSQNVSPEVDIRKSKCSPEVDFRKSKYITRSWLSKIKMYHRKSTSGSQNVHRKSTSGSQNISLEVDLLKSKCITFRKKSKCSPEVKMYHRKSTFRNQKTNSILNIFNSF